MLLDNSSLGSAEAPPCILPRRTRSPGKIKVLVADDLPLNVKMMCRNIQNLPCGHFTICTASTAEEVVELVIEANASFTPFDLLIIDENFMDPDGSLMNSGSTAIKEIRALESLNGVRRPLAIISWTSDSDSQLISEKLLEYGADLVWGKPGPQGTQMQADLCTILGSNPDYKS